MPSAIRFVFRNRLCQFQVDVNFRDQRIGPGVVGFLAQQGTDVAGREGEEHVPGAVADGLVFRGPAGLESPEIGFGFVADAQDVGILVRIDIREFQRGNVVIDVHLIEGRTDETQHADR